MRVFISYSRYESEDREKIKSLYLWVLKDIETTAPWSSVSIDNVELIGSHFDRPKFERWHHSPDRSRVYMNGSWAMADPSLWSKENFLFSSSYSRHNSEELIGAYEAGLKEVYHRILGETSLIHRDLKPDNIIVEPGVPGRVKLLDFGLAKKARPDDPEEIRKLSEEETLLKSLESQITEALTHIDESRKDLEESFARTSLLREETNRLLASIGG